jgi:hypothetical protein
MMDLLEALVIAKENFPEGPEAVAARIGVEICSKTLTGCAGWCIRNNNVARITINSTMPSVRQRFTLAHELSHLLLGSNSEVRSDADFFGSNEGEEKAADRLAAEMLLPKEEIQRIVTAPPVDAATIRKLANKANVSPVMVACRIAELAQPLGLINAAVVSFKGDKIAWIWSTTLTVHHEKARTLLGHAREAAGGTFQEANRSGETVVASVIDSPTQACLFIQALPASIGNSKSRAQILSELGRWLFEGNTSFRGQVNGCLSSFKPTARNKDINTALRIFNEKYIGRWTGAAGDRIRDPRGQQFLRLRLGEWTRPGEQSSTN